MGNSRSNYERHEDDEQQQRMVIGKQFRLILGQLDLPSDIVKRKKTFSNYKQAYSRKVSLSSSNSTITSSSSSDHHNSSIYFLQLDIPTSPFSPNEIDANTLIQYLLNQDTYGKELTHVFKIPNNMNISNNNQKSQLKTLPTVKIAAVYYDSSSTNHDLHTETISLSSENELEGKIQEFNEKNIQCIYTSSKSEFYLSY